MLVLVLRDSISGELAFSRRYVLTKRFRARG